MTRVLRQLAALFLTAALLAGAAPALAAPATPVTDVSTQAARVQAFKDLVKLLEAYKAGQPVDWAAGKQMYADKLQATVRARDAEFSQQLDIAVTAALAAGASGQLPAAIAKQLVDKLLQKVFYLNVVHEFDVALVNLGKGDHPTAIHNIDEAIAYFEALRGTVQKRDQAFQLNMEAELDGLLAAAQQAVAQKNETDLHFLRAAASSTLLRTFYLAVLTYAEKIPAEPNQDNARTMMAEGWAFFQSLKGVVGAPYAAEVEALLDPLQGDPARVSVDAVKAPIALAFLAHGREEIGGTFAEWGKSEAVGKAVRGALAVRALDPEFAALLGDAGKQALDAAQLSFVQAVRAGDRAQAQAAAEALLSPIGALEGQLHGTRGGVVLTLHSTRAQVGGAVREIEAAPFVTAGGRAMVPVRVVAEALGAKVAWLADSRTVSITGGGKTILLPVGRAEATVDGQVRSLDAAAEMRGGRAFVPVRFVAEILGARVQWVGAAQQVIIMPAR